MIQPQSINLLIKYYVGLLLSLKPFNLIFSSSTKISSLSTIIKRFTRFENFHLQMFKISSKKKLREKKCFESHLRMFEIFSMCINRFFNMCHITLKMFTLVVCFTSVNCLIDFWHNFLLISSQLWHLRHTLWEVFQLKYCTRGTKDDENNLHEKGKLEISWEWIEHLWKEGSRLICKLCSS